MGLLGECKNLISSNAFICELAESIFIYQIPPFLLFLSHRQARSYSKVGMRLVCSLEKIGEPFSETSNAPVEPTEFWSMFSPKQPPKNISSRFSWNLWYRGWLLIAGMNAPPIPTPIRPICTIEIALERRALAGGRGYSSPTTKISGRRYPNFSLNCSNAFPYDQLLQNCINKTGV